MLKLLNIADSQIELLASFDQSMQKDVFDSESEEWLDSAEAEQIDAALVECQRTRRQRKGDWQIPLIAALLLHVFGVIALAEIAMRFGSTARWHMAPGDPAAQGGSPITGIVQGAESEFVAPNPIVVPPGNSSRAEQHPLADDAATDDSSVLPIQMPSPMPDSADPLVGIGPGQSPQKLPRFASTKPSIATAVQFAGAMSSASTAPAVGAATPPRVASLGGGRRGERDGFDSRGLPIPDYPAESRRRGEEGLIVVDVEVLSDGTVGQIRIVSDAGYPRLAVAAAEALKSASFEPAREDGKPAVGHLLIPYRFTLE